MWCATSARPNSSSTMRICVDAVHLGNDEAFEPGPYDRFDVFDEAFGGDGIHAHEARGRAVERDRFSAIAETFSSEAPICWRAFCFRDRRNAVLDIHHDGIDMQRQRLVDHALPVARHEHPGTEESRA